MARLLALILFGLLAASCAPSTRNVPGAEPIFYIAEPAEVFGTVIQAISTSPGLDNSNGWIITQSDSQGGFIRAETRVSTYSFWTGAISETEVLTVVISPAGANRTQVVIQLTTGARELSTRVEAALRSAYGVN